MTHSELHQSWARTEAFLRDAKQALPRSMAEEHAADLVKAEEFLSHNELGLAADWLTEIAAESPNEALATIKSLILAEGSMGRFLQQKKLESLLSDARGNS